MTTEPRILFFDIESTNLAANFGTILCIGWKWHGSKVCRVPTILDTGGKDCLDDKGLVKKFAEVYNTADYTCGWYSSRFDIPMIRTKLLKHRLPPLAPIPHLDLWRTARYKLKLHSNRLQVVQEFLGTTHDKTPIHFDDWLKAAVGDRKALAHVRKHCELDVRVLEEVFDIMRPLIVDEPNRGLMTGETGLVCQSCGSSDVQARGTYISLTRRYKRYNCQSCGKWMKVRVAEKGPSLTLVNASG